MPQIQQLGPKNDWIAPLLQGIQQQAQQKQDMALALIKAGAYSPVLGGKQHGPIASMGASLLGPTLGPTTNVDGMNFAFNPVNPQINQLKQQAQLKQLQDSLKTPQQQGQDLKTEMDALNKTPTKTASDGTQPPPQMITKPSIRMTPKGPQISLSTQLNPDYKTWQQNIANNQQAQAILKSKPGDEGYEFAKDLAYGKITIPFFESQLRGFSGNTMAIRNAYYAKAKAINPSFNESMFENGMYGIKNGLSAIGRLQALTGQAAKNVDAQLNVAVGLSGKINRSTYPILNKADYLWNTDVKQIPGLSGDIKNFIYSAKLASIDAARVETGQTTGAAVTDSAREYFKNLLDATDSKETFMKQAAFTSASTHNRMVSLANERQDMLNQIKDMQMDLQGNPVPKEQYEDTGDIDQMAQGKKPIGSGKTDQDQSQNSSDPLGIL